MAGRKMTMNEEIILQNIFSFAHDLLKKFTVITIIGKNS